MLVGQMRTFARYNGWANERLAAALGALDEADYRADRGLFFRSIHGTLNHLLVADRIWFHRITGETDGQLPARLDENLHDNREELASARRREDARIVGVVDGLDDAALTGTLAYRNISGATFSQPLGLVLAHVFNHQTHHRGQVHAALTALGREAPPLDLVYYLREVGPERDREPGR